MTSSSSSTESKSAGSSTSATLNRPQPAGLAGLGCVVTTATGVPVSLAILAAPEDSDS